MIRLLAAVSISLLIISCSSDPKVNEDVSEWDSIAQIEDQLYNATDADEINELKLKLRTDLLNFSKENAGEEKAAEALYKLHMSYASDGQYETSAKYGDQLIKEYPAFSMREIVIESQYNNYDMFIQPRNKARAKEYLELWLKEYPDMDSTKRVDIKYRLEYIDLPIEQIMEMKMKELK